MERPRMLMFLDGFLQFGSQITVITAVPSLNNMCAHALAYRENSVHREIQLFKPAYVSELSTNTRKTAFL